MTTNPRRILIVDDNTEDRSYITRLLKKGTGWDWQFAEASKGEQGLDLAVSGGPFDCVLLDYRLPDMDGIQFLQSLRKRVGEPGLPTLVVTGAGDESIAVSAMKLGAQDYFSKSNLSPELLLHAVDKAISGFQRHLANRRTEQRLLRLYDSGMLGVCYWNFDGKIEEANDKFLESTKYTRQDLSSGEVNWTMMTPPEYAHLDRQALAQVKTTGVCKSYEKEFIRKDGTRLHIEMGGAALDDQRSNGVAFILDITARKQAESNLLERTRKLERALSEKTVLLKEIHHRVKNNLAVVSSLLSMQADSIDNTEASDALLESQHRVQSMALIHEHLYGNEDLDRIRLDEYAKTLASEMYASFGSPSRISVVVEADPIELGVDKAIPCGLILNELITNAFKYAFPEGRSGDITISLAEQPPGKLSLSVADNGSGFSESFDWRNAKSLGLRIIQILCAQLEGILELDQNSGIQFTLTFSCEDGSVRRVREL